MQEHDQFFFHRAQILDSDLLELLKPVFRDLERHGNPGFIVSHSAFLPALPVKLLRRAHTLLLALAPSLSPRWRLAQDRGLRA